MKLLHPVTSPHLGQEHCVLKNPLNCVLNYLNFPYFYDDRGESVSGPVNSDYTDNEMSLPLLYTNGMMKPVSMKGTA
jgi:hypothetical protein